MSTIQNFIGVYENTYSKNYCNLIINHFDNMEKNGFSLNRQQLGKKSIEIDDDSLYAHSCKEINLMPSGTLSEFNVIFWEKYKEYTKKFSILETFGNHNSYTFKVQKTNIGGGYHVWHSEASHREVCHRILAWTVYLNDVEEGGETEFLYQHVRIKPKQGTLCFFPAGFTHTHRGNPPLSNTKYIITGWVEF